MTSQPNDPDPSDRIRGGLNIMGLDIDLGKLLSSPESLQEQLTTLRGRLRDMGGRALTDEAQWQAGASSLGVSGRITTRGPQGDREYHVGATPRPVSRTRQPLPTEVTEPATDVFYEPDAVVIIAQVPGANLADLNVQVEHNTVSLITRETARWPYRKVLTLDRSVVPARCTSRCENGILELRVPLDRDDAAPNHRL